MELAFAPITYAGRHLILDLYGVPSTLLTNDVSLKKILEEGCLRAGASILHSHFHHFGVGYGVTGIIVLAESHCSIHTWTETGYASIDIYMCGDCDPSITSTYIKEHIPHIKNKDTILYRGSGC